MFAFAPCSINFCRALCVHSASILFVLNRLRPMTPPLRPRSPFFVPSSHLLRTFLRNKSRMVQKCPFGFVNYARLRPLFVHCSSIVRPLFAHCSFPIFHCSSIVRPLFVNSVCLRPFFAPASSLLRPFFVLVSSLLRSFHLRPFLKAFFGPSSSRIRPFFVPFSLILPVFVPSSSLHRPFILHSILKTILRPFFVPYSFLLRPFFVDSTCLRQSSSLLPVFVSSSSLLEGPSSSLLRSSWLFVRSVHVFHLSWLTMSVASSAFVI